MTDVIIVGGGLSGMSAAHELADAGLSVLLLEANPYLGGRTSSWVEDGMPVESGLHKYLGFYSAMPRLFKKAGIDLEDVVIWNSTLEITLPDGQPSGEFGAAPLYSPLKTLWGVLGNNDFLPLRDKLSLMPFFAAGLWAYATKDPLYLDQYSVAEFAQKYKVTARACDRVLIPLTAGLFFLMPEQYSAYVFFGIIGSALKRGWQTRVGSFRGGMTEVMMKPLAASLQKKGGEVRLNQIVAQILVEDARVVGVQVRDQDIRAPYVILATSLKPAQDLLRNAFGNHPAFVDMLQLQSMPAVTLQLELSQPAKQQDWTTFGPTTVIGTYAEQSRTTFNQLPGRLSTILSPPSEFINQEPDQIYARAYPDLLRLGLDIEDRVEHYRVIKHPYDFYALTPGQDKLRPNQRTPITGFTLAGDYTRQPFFTSMEGAVRSGVLAAECVKESL